MEYIVLISMRSIAWEKAKAEMRAMMCTMDSQIRYSTSKLESFRDVVDDFIERVESKGFNE